jgi:hypothetical protein
MSLSVHINLALMRDELECGAVLEPCIRRAIVSSVWTKALSEAKGTRACRRAGESLAE